MEQQSFHPLDYLSVANRRKWWFVVPLVTCMADRRRRGRRVAQEIRVEGGDRHAVADAVA